VDADWKGAYAEGDEAVGGSTATPDQDVVDERDRHRWTLEREAAGEAGDEA
jgi:hypothetical protein